MKRSMESRPSLLKTLRPLARRQLVHYRHRGLRPADALLVSYPKSGTTWLRFLVAHAITGTEADFDSIRQVFPPLGRQRGAPGLLADGGRLVRTHEPLRPYRGRPGQHVVYLVRDGHDVALSYLDHHRRLGRYTGDVTVFLDDFLAGRLDGYGPWADHVLGADDFARSGVAPVLTIRYEELRADTEAQLARVLAFVGHAVDDEVVARVVAANTKERMRAKEAASRFLASQTTDGSPIVRPDRRQGWADLVPADTRAEFDQACAGALASAGYPAGRGT